MVARSKLKVALAAEKGLTDKKVKQMKDKKKHKAAIKDKRKKGLLPEEDKDSEEDSDWEEDDEDDEEDSEAENGLFDVEAEESEESEGDESEDEELGGATSAAALMNESDTDSESEVDMEEKIQRTFKPKSILKKASAADKKAGVKKTNKDNGQDDEEEEEEEEEESDIALSDLEDMNDSDREDLYVKTRLSINNGPALLASLKRIALPRDGSVPFSVHQLVASSELTASKIEDISDDLNRELQLYAQSLEAAKKARALLRAEGVPFSRPNDYFAEMVKDDGHMEKVKAKLVEEATNKKAAAEARKLRDLKKFGKQVQVAKLQERAKQKRETLEKIKALKKKRSENGNDLATNEADLFDVGVDNELNKSGKRSRGGDDHGGRNSKRAKKDAKYGFGGKKRHAKSGDAVSSGDLSGFNTRKMKGQQGGGGGKKKPFKTARLGKSKRVAKAGKR